MPPAPPPGYLPDSPPAPRVPGPPSGPPSAAPGPGASAEAAWGLRPGRLPDRLNPLRPRIGLKVADRALDLTAEPVGRFQYRVSGGSEEHYVEIAPYFECWCARFLYAKDNAPVLCKHLVAALAADGDPAAVAALEDARHLRELALNPPLAGPGAEPPERCRPPRPRRPIRRAATESNAGRGPSV